MTNSSKQLAPDAPEVARALLSIHCVEFNVHTPYTWVSGLRSPVYCDNRKIYSDLRAREVVLNSFVNLIHDKFSDTEIIAGVATGGIPMGILIAYKLNKPFVYVRQEPKKHGLKKQVEGTYKEGDRVVLIEDLVSTGGSSLKAIAGLRNEGLQVDAMISIMTYGLETSVRSFIENNVAHYSLCNLNTVLATAVEAGSISEEEKESILQFRADPKNWKFN